MALVFSVFSVLFTGTRTSTNSADALQSILGFKQADIELGDGFLKGCFCCIEGVGGFNPALQQLGKNQYPISITHRVKRDGQLHQFSIADKHDAGHHALVSSLDNKGQIHLQTRRTSAKVAS